MVDYWATTMGNWPLVSWPLVSWSLVSFLLGLSPGVDGGQSGLPHSHSHRVYVVLSIVKTIKSLIFNRKLNDERDYPRWEYRILNFL